MGNPLQQITSHFFLISLCQFVTPSCFVTVGDLALQQFSRTRKIPNLPHLAHCSVAQLVDDCHVVPPNHCRRITCHRCSRSCLLGRNSAQPQIRMALFHSPTLRQRSADASSRQGSLPPTSASCAWFLTAALHRSFTRARFTCMTGLEVASSLLVDTVSRPSVSKRTGRHHYQCQSIRDPTKDSWCGRREDGSYSSPLLD